MELFAKGEAADTADAAINIKNRMIYLHDNKHARLPICFPFLNAGFHPVESLNNALWCSDIQLRLEQPPRLFRVNVSSLKSEINEKNRSHLTGATQPLHCRHRDPSAAGARRQTAD